MTIERGRLTIFAAYMLESFKIIAFTHKTISIEGLGKFNLDEDVFRSRLSALRESLSANEIMVISTCNRVEFLFVNDSEIDHALLEKFFSGYKPEWKKSEINWAIENALIYSGNEAMTHLYQVASSIDSLVVGEREIITQVRNAYEKCHKAGLTGDLLRLIIKNTIETAKTIYTRTHISSRPVSVVSLAYRRLRDLNVKINSRILFIGSGVTNSTMAKYLKKHGFKNFAVFNRSFENAEKLSLELNGKAFPLSSLSNYRNGFDVVIACTSSGRVILDGPLFNSLSGKDQDKKILIDLAVPSNIDPELAARKGVQLISIMDLQEIASRNLKEREGEIEHCKEIIKESLAVFSEILKERKVELLLKDLPRKVKEIKSFALNEVFAKDLSKLDDHSKELLGRVLDYMEKKYISVPMKMAKEIILFPETSAHE